MPTYLYRPVAATGGATLRCLGVSTPGYRAVVRQQANDRHDGVLLANGVVVETPEYFGHEIPAITSEQAFKVSCLSTALATLTIAECINALTADGWEYGTTLTRLLTT